MNKSLLIYTQQPNSEILEQASESLAISCDQDKILPNNFDQLEVIYIYFTSDMKEICDYLDFIIKTAVGLGIDIIVIAGCEESIPAYIGNFANRYAGQSFEPTKRKRHPC